MYPFNAQKFTCERRVDHEHICATAVRNRRRREGKLVTMATLDAWRHRLRIKATLKERAAAKVAK